jgi:hypothetical protein
VIPVVMHDVTRNPDRHERAAMLALSLVSRADAGAAL